MMRVARQSRRKRWDEITVVLLDDRSIAEANARCFGRPEVTDVISQAYRPDPATTGWCGEVLVNVSAATRRGGDRIAAGRELALYLAHGCDHLVGNCDDTPSRRRAMLARNRRALRGACRAGFSLDLIRPQPPRPTE